jgi:ketosteroid isomerase-like protein
LWALTDSSRYQPPWPNERCRVHAKAKAAGRRDTASVSAENAELVCSLLERLNKSSDEIRAVITELCDSDVDYYPVRKFPESRPCHGREDFSEFLVRFREAFSDYRAEIDEVIAVGDDRVLACLNLRAEGRESGVNLEGGMYHCAWLRHGRFFRIEDHLTLSGALHALGLEGETLEAARLRAPSNLDLVRSIFAAWERGDWSSAEWAHLEIEFERVEEAWRGRWVGLAGMAQGWREWLSAWEDFRIAHVEEYREIDSERVIVLHRFSGRGKTSGVDVEETQAKGASLFHIRDGKVTRVVAYSSRDLVFADLGLTAETGSSE